MKGTIGRPENRQSSSPLTSIALTIPRFQSLSRKENWCGSSTRTRLVFDPVVAHAELTCCTVFDDGSTRFVRWSQSSCFQPLDRRYRSLLPLATRTTVVLFPSSPHTQHHLRPSLAVHASHCPSILPSRPNSRRMVHPLDALGHDHLVDDPVHDANDQTHRSSTQVLVLSWAYTDVFGHPFDPDPQEGRQAEGVGRAYGAGALQGYL